MFNTEPKCSKCTSSERNELKWGAKIRQNVWLMCLCIVYVNGIFHVFLDLVTRRNIQYTANTKCGTIFVLWSPLYGSIKFYAQTRGWVMFEKTIFVWNRHPPYYPPIHINFMSIVVNRILLYSVFILHPIVIIKGFATPLYVCYSVLAETFPILFFAKITIKNTLYLGETWQ